VWPGALVGLAAFGIFLAKVYQLFFKKEPGLRSLRRGLPSLLLLACAGVFNGVFGFFLGMQTSMFHMATDQERAWFYFMRWLVGSSATMILSLLVAIFAALFWIVLINKVKRIELAKGASWASSRATTRR